MLRSTPRSTLRAAAAALAIALTAAACAPSEPSAVASEAAPAAAASAPAWPRLPPPGDLPEDRPLQAAFLVVDGVYNTELTAPYDVLEHTDAAAAPYPGIEVFAVSQDGGEVTTYEGLRVRPHYSFADAPPIDILVVPSAEHSRDTDRDNAEMIAWVRRVGGEARVVMSLCWGAFVLAEAGLLDGRACTTFPSDFDRFAETFPHLDVQRGVSFVHDGKALTSQGGVKSFEAAMYLVDHLYGEPAAQRIGGGLLIDWPPAPGSVAAWVVGAM